MDSYVCELCIYKEEKLMHLFFRCPFCKELVECYWDSGAALA
jgi:hypothetical protein